MDVRKWGAVFICVAGLAGCPNKAVFDGGFADTGPVGDSGLQDSGAPDSGLSDSGPGDAGPSDAGPADAGPPTHCTIGASSYADGAINPANPCQSCQLAVDPDGWSDLSSGTACGDGGVCANGLCDLGSACGPALACFDGRCRASDCVGAAHNAPCGLADGGTGLCAGGSCQNVPNGGDNANCGFFGAACPPVSDCTPGYCILDAGGAPDCASAPCPQGQLCVQPYQGFGAICVAATCSTGHDDQICALDGGIAYSNGGPEPQICCGSACINTAFDPNNCGGCGLACQAGEVCLPSRTVLTPGYPTQGQCLPTSCTGRASGTVCERDGGTGSCCGGDATCRDLRFDSASCGVCGMACPVGFSCSGGECVRLDSTGDQIPCFQDPNCPPGWTCNDQNFCLPDCSSALDGVTCGSSYVNSFANVRLNKECCGHSCMDLGIDPANCGACGHACAAGEACGAGGCQKTDCSATTGAIGAFTTCVRADGGGGVCCGGGCTDPLSDPLNCSFCRNACTVGASCISGYCWSPGDAGFAGSCQGTCPAGTLCMPGVTTDCLATVCGPNDNGGTCARVDAGKALGYGTCCSGVCLDLNTDFHNCGGCGQICPDGMDAGCSSGLCGGDFISCLLDGGPQCPDGLVCAGAVCLSPAPCTGAVNGVPCLFGLNFAAPGQIIVGQCCSGACVDVTQDPNNCGACGAKSTSGLCFIQPSPGSCVDPECSDLLSDPQNCGGCGVVCLPGQTCTAGVCSGSPACGPGHWAAFCDLDAGLLAGDLTQAPVCCPGVGCTNISSDSQNCFACGRSCPAGQTCHLGACQ